MHTAIFAAFVAIAIFSQFGLSEANKAKTCYTCEGINCMRTSLATTKTCSDPLDYCVTVFEKCKFVLDFKTIQK